MKPWASAVIDSISAMIRALGNVLISMGFFAASYYICALTPPERVPDMANVILMLGTGSAAIVGGRVWKDVRIAQAGKNGHKVESES